MEEKVSISTQEGYPSNTKIENVIQNIGKCSICGRTPTLINMSVVLTGKVESVYYKNPQEYFSEKGYRDCVNITQYEGEIDSSFQAFRSKEEHIGDVHLTFLCSLDHYTHVLISNSEIFFAKKEYIPCRNPFVWCIDEGCHFTECKCPTCNHKTDFHIENINNPLDFFYKHLCFDNESKTSMQAGIIISCPICNEKIILALLEHEGHISLSTYQSIYTWDKVE